MDRGAKHIFYDAQCGLCSGTARRWRKPLSRRGWTFTPMQENWARKLLGLNDEKAPVPDQMALITEDGKLLWGTQAVLHLYRQRWWLYPIWLAAKVKLVRKVFATAYGWVARHRYGISESCNLKGDWQ